jgi:uracil-DNA glycosylase family 4
VTRRRSRYRALSSVQRDNRGCNACAEAGYLIESPPVFEGGAGQRAMIVGQAPGLTEGEEGRPWRGRAGRALRAWLELDEDSFYRTFYCTSVTRCYPGRHPSGRGDRAATPPEMDLCAFWLEWELRLLEPDLVLPVGGRAIRRLLGLARLTDCIGERYRLAGGAVAVPLPHPSGASGWLNDGENRERLATALSLVHAELRRLA